MVKSLILLKNKYDSLTAAERRIADYILQNGSSIIDLNTAAIAKQSGSAASAVIRLCKKLGFKGYSQFKINLAMELTSADTVILPNIDISDDTQSAFKKVFESGIKTLSDTAQMLDMQLVSNAVNILDTANQICFLGIGTSSTIAVDAHYRIMQLGYHATCSTDILFMQVAASNLSTGDVAVGISHSGKTIATIEALKIAKERGAVTIVLTSYKDSPICEYADIVINVYSDETIFPIEAVSARIAHITVIDSIMVALALKRYDNALKKIANRNDILKSIRGENKRGK